MNWFQLSLAALTALLMSVLEHFDLLSADDDDLPVMPADYYDWADPQLWKQTCVQPKDRRM